MMPLRGFAVAVLMLVAAAPAEQIRPVPVAVVRLPDAGIQPRLVNDGRVAHIVYFKGDAAAGDLYYTSTIEGGGPFTPSIRINQQSRSAIATGSVRGANLALGRNGRVHVAWMGSDRAQPRAAGNATPMMYTRLDDAGTAFEPERNVLQHATGLDGGGTVAADSSGRVFVVWHAGGPTSQSEADRRVWLATSRDDGKTFARERAISPVETGACGCCGIHALADRGGGVSVLYRAATAMVHRDTYLLSSTDRGETFAASKLDEWEIAACPMSTYTLSDTPAGVLASWETAGQVKTTRPGARSGASAILAPALVPGEKPTRRHPVAAANAAGEIILVWTEGTAWQRGGAVAWQVFDAKGAPTSDRGRKDGIPVWSFAAVFARADGRFTIVY